MAKRTMETLIRVEGRQHRPICIGEVLDYKGWPTVACYKATWQQLEAVAEEILDEEDLLAAEHDEYSSCDEGAIEEIDLLDARYND